LKNRLDFNSSSPAAQVPGADAKRKGYILPKQLKLLIKGKETQDLLLTLQTSHSTKP
jgi:hypothetical protein